MFWIKNLVRISPTTSSVGNVFRNPESYTLSSRFCTALQKQQVSETVQAKEVVNGLEPQRYDGLAPTREGEKPRVLVLGSGWAGCRLMKGIDTSIYDVVCVSPRNHMVFTPLLASTCVGTLEFRSVAEPISRIQPAISREPGSYYFLANCSKLDADNHEVIFKNWKLKYWVKFLKLGKSLADVFFLLFGFFYNLLNVEEDSF